MMKKNVQMRMPFCVSNEKTLCFYQRASQCALPRGSQCRGPQTTRVSVPPAALPVRLCAAWPACVRRGDRLDATCVLDRHSASVSSRLKFQNPVLPLRIQRGSDGSATSLFRRAGLLLVCCVHGPGG